jgi:uncharacterized protein YjbJ (UPF0337 family)
MIYSPIEINTMNTTEENGNRQKQNGALKQRFASLTDDDQLFKEGKEQEELGKRQIRLGKTEEELTKIIAGL